MYSVYRLIISLCAALLLTSAIMAQEATALTYAGVRDNTIVIQQADGTPVSVENPENNGLTHLAWSPDGSKLAYVLIDPDYNWQVMVVNADGSNPVALNTGRVENGFPLAWTPNNQLLFAQSPDLNAMGEEYYVTIATIAPEADAEPQALGEVLFGVGCGGGSPLPTDWQYWAETGFGGSPLMLEWMLEGIIYSASCSGAGYGLLIPETGDSYYLTSVLVENNIPTPVDHISRAKLSPDGSMLVGIRTVYAEPDPIESLVLIDFGSLDVIEIPTQWEPDQVAWSAAGEVYYATRAAADADLLDDLTDAQRSRLEALGTGFTIGSNTVTIVRVDPETGEETAVFMGDAAYVGRMLETPDGSLWFSLIPNPGAWLEALGNGAIDVLTDVNGRQQLATVPVTVYQLEGDGVRIIAENLNQFTLRPVTD